MKYRPTGRRALGTLFSQTFIDYFRIALLLSALVIELRIFTKAHRCKGLEMDHGSLRVVVLGVCLSVAAFLLFAFSGAGKLPMDLRIVGFAIVVSGLALRQWAIRALGRLFTPRVSFEEHHTIIAFGPYRYLRHPSYTGLVLEFAGAALALPNIFALAVMLACIVPALQYRIRIEERFLTEKFGEAYAEFKKKTPRIFP